jgi:acetyltransferase
MMEQTRIFAALRGVRGRRPIDVPALAGLLVRFSQLVVEQPWISEIDINPLLASPEQLLALDARVVLHPPGTDPDHLPKPAVRPYPAQYVSSWVMKNGTEVTLRPIRPEDEPLMVKFHETLSDRSVYLRYFYSISLSSRVAHDRLVRICFVDYDREMAIVADWRDANTDEHRILGVGRLIKSHAKNEGEVAVLISDAYQNQGLGIELFRRVIQVARDEKLSSVEAEILPDNFAMKKIAKKLGFRVQTPDDPTAMRAVLNL